ncbi:MAG: TrmH family RNA methyltransferase, partial [Phreatobacter sp.]
MPGIDITRLAREKGSPVIILVEPQMAENIGTTARAMANFGMARLRLVAPRDGWPNGRAYPAASGANKILDEVELFATLDEAIADLTLAYAATARMHGQ